MTSSKLSETQCTVYLYVDCPIHQTCRPRFLQVRYPLWPPRLHIDRLVRRLIFLWSSARARIGRPETQWQELVPVSGWLLCSASVSGIRDHFGAMPELGRGCMKGSVHKVWRCLSTTVIFVSWLCPWPAFERISRSSPAAGRPATVLNLLVPLGEAVSRSDEGPAPAGTISLATRFFGSVMPPARVSFPPSLRPSCYCWGSQRHAQVAGPAPSSQPWPGGWRSPFSSIQLRNLIRDRLSWFLGRCPGLSERNYRTKAPHSNAGEGGEAQTCLRLAGDGLSTAFEPTAS